MLVLAKRRLRMQELVALLADRRERGAAKCSVDDTFEMSARADKLSMRKDNS